MTLTAFNSKSVLTAGLFILLTGCSGYQYVASPRFAPFNEKKGTLTANLYPGSVQVGYSFSDKFSAFATGFRRVPQIASANPFSTEKNHRSGESNEINIGLSYFKKKEKIVSEILWGTGVGQMTFENNFSHDKNQAAGYSFQMQAKKKNMFVQPGLAWKFTNPKVDRRFAIGIFAKFNYVQYYDIIATGSYGVDAEPDSGIEYFSNRDEANLFFIEPGLIMKLGAKNFKSMLQIAPIINASGHALHYNIFSINIGFTFNASLLKRSQKKEEMKVGN